MSDEKYYFLIFALFLILYFLERIGKRIDSIYRMLKFGKDDE